MSKFTTAGLNLLAAWEADPTQKRPIKYIAIGDLTDEQYANADLHDGSETELHDQQYFGDVNRVYQAAEDNAIARVEALIDFDTRGWNMREVGLFVEAEDPADDPILIWISHHPDTHVPLNLDDMIISEIVTVPIKFSTADAVELLTVNTALVNYYDFLGQAAETAVRDTEINEHIGLLKNAIAGG